MGFNSAFKELNTSHDAQPSRTVEVPYILESNPHPFYSFRGLKIRCGLQSRAD